MTKDLTIVVTTKNGYSFTRYCLESITWTLPRELYDIVIVDNGSTDETLDFQGLDGIRFVENQGASLYGSWNIGIEEARTEFVVVLNNDVVFVTPDWWRWLRAGLNEHDLDWVFPLGIESQKPFFDTYKVIRESASLGKLVIESRLGWFEACCFAIRKSLVNDLGSFDDRFEIWYGEKDYEIRLLASARRYAAIRNVVIRHFGSSTLRVGLDERRVFEGAAIEDLANLNSRAHADFETFKRKWSDAELAPLGLRIPPFGRKSLAVPPSGES